MQVSKVRQSSSITQYKNSYLSHSPSLCCRHHLLELQAFLKSVWFFETTVGLVTLQRAHIVFLLLQELSLRVVNCRGMLVAVFEANWNWNDICWCDNCKKGKVHALTMARIILLHSYESMLRVSPTHFNLSWFQIFLPRKRYFQNDSMFPQWHRHRHAPFWGLCPFLFFLNVFTVIVNLLIKFSPSTAWPLWLRAAGADGQGPLLRLQHG